MAEGSSLPNAIPVRKNLAIPLALIMATLVALTSIAIVVLEARRGPLSEVDGGIEYKISDLPEGFYRPWDKAGVSIYSGEPTREDNYIIYPNAVGWALNSSALTGSGPKIYDFGARNISGAWFNLTACDIHGDGEVNDGDYIRVTSFNGSFDPNTDYYLRFTVHTVDGIAPFYTVLGFRFSPEDFDAWVEVEPNETAL